MTSTVHQTPYSAILIPDNSDTGTVRRLRACKECDWVVQLPPLRPGDKADCPRCGHTLARRYHRPAQRSMAYGISALIALIIAVIFPFASFEIPSIGRSIGLPETASTMIGFRQPLVAIVVAMTIIVLPAIYLVSLIWLQIGLMRGRLLPGTRTITRTLTQLGPWMMADVFILGALVSLIKIAGSVDIQLGTGFWAFASFAVLLLVTTQSMDADWIWFAIAGEPSAPEGTLRGQTAASQGVAGCDTCGLINSLDADGKGHCSRCDDALHARLPNSMQRTSALLMAAAVMYIPANFYPIMTTINLGRAKDNTILGGVAELWRTGDWPIALIIFIASIVVPVVKLGVIAWLCFVVNRSDGLNPEKRTHVYRITEFIGRWSMVDVFAVALMVALIRGGSLMSINPGPAALAFCSVVVLTMLAAITFDPRFLWDAAPPTEFPANHSTNTETST
ncbi:MAG: paraquat-inducible protein A [Pseudomonadota bacterium]